MQGDRAAAIVFILVSVVFWTQTSGLQYNGAIFPRAIIVFIILLSVGLFVQKTVGKGEEQKTFLPPNLGYVLFPSSSSPCGFTVSTSWGSSFRASSFFPS